MKKIIALVMALVMMMAVAVPAFADDITKETAQSGSATVATKTSDTDATYTVTYPALIMIDWGDTNPYNVNYAVTSQLPIGASLEVSVIADDSGKMTSGNAVGYELYYTLSGGTVQTFSEINNAAAPETHVTVAIPDFSQAVPDTYEGTLTYKVVYTAT